MKCWIWCLLLSAAFAQNTNASPTGHEWINYSDGLKTGYVLGFINGTTFGAIREMGTCFDLVNISLNIINTSNEFFEQWKEKHPEIVTAATSHMLSQAERPEFKQDFCLKRFNSGFENITVGQFLSGVNNFYQDYRNQGIPVNYALQYVRDGVNGKSPAEQNADLLLERKCVADPNTCAGSKPDSVKP